MSDTISKYFLRKDGSGSNKEGDQSIEDDDFKTPKRINTKSNIKVTKKVNERKPKKRVDKSQLRLTKIAKQNSPLEVDPDHWQLAIALSRSLQKPGDEEASCSEYPSSQEKIASLRENLQQFGFKSGAALEVQKRRPPVEKKKKKSKFQFVTPVLLMRKQEDREQIIAEKISLILSENVENCPDYLTICAPKRPKPFSRNLQQFWKGDKRVYDIHGFSSDLLKSSDLFYVETLNFETDKLKCGDLLKNWSDIPGRDISPVRNLCFDDLSFAPTQKDNPTPQKDNLTPQKVVRSPRRSMSPELFDSDDELFIPPKVSDSPSLQKFKQKTAHCSNTWPSSQVKNLDAIQKNSEDERNFGLSTKFSTQNSNFDSGVFGETNKISNSPPFSSTQSGDIIQDKSGVFGGTNKISSSPPFASTQSDNTIIQDKSGVFGETNEISNSPPFPSTQSDNTIIQDKSGVFGETNEISNSPPFPSTQSDNTIIQDKSGVFGETNEISSSSPFPSTQSDNTIIQDKSEVFGETNKISNSPPFPSTQSDDSIIQDKSGVFGKTNEISHSPPFPSTQSDETIIQDKSYSKLLELTSPNCFKNSTFLSPKNVLIENDNGICVFESFSKEGNEISDSIDLTLTSDEDERKSPVASNSFTFETPVSRSPKKLKRKSHSFSFDKRTTEKIRRSNSLNVTDYVNGVLNKDWKSMEEIPKSPILERSWSTSSSTSLASQKSYYISDEELNYSCKFGLDLSDHEEDMPILLGEENVFATPSEILTHPRVTDLNHETQTRKSLFQLELGTPTSDVIIKTENVTPVLNYDEFSTPTLHRELSKFGLKPMKRQRGVQILKHLYESTHPFVDSVSESDQEDTKVVKKRKCGDGKKKSPKEALPDQIGKCIMEENIAIVGNLISECDTDIIFEKKRSSKIASCQLPLHIAWHNLVTSQPNLQQNILLYEPIQLEVIYCMLKEQGHAFHIQDIMTFLDKNCINIKIEQNTNRGYCKRKKDKPSKKS